MKNDFDRQIEKSFNLLHDAVHGRLVTGLNDITNAVLTGLQGELGITSGDVPFDADIDLDGNIEECADILAGVIIRILILQRSN